MLWDLPADARSCGELRSLAPVQVALEVPKWMRAFPVSSIEKTGSSVLLRVLSRMLPRQVYMMYLTYLLKQGFWQSRLPCPAFSKVH